MPSPLLSRSALRALTLSLMCGVSLSACAQGTDSWWKRGSGNEVEGPRRAPLLNPQGAGAKAAGSAHAPAKHAPIQAEAAPAPSQSIFNERPYDRFGPDGRELPEGEAAPVPAPAPAATAPAPSMIYREEPTPTPVPAPAPAPAAQRSWSDRLMGAFAPEPEQEPTIKQETQQAAQAADAALSHPSSIRKPVPGNPPLPPGLAMPEPADAPPPLTRRDEPADAPALAATEPALAEPALSQPAQAEEPEKPGFFASLWQRKEKSEPAASEPVEHIAAADDAETREASAPAQALSAKPEQVTSTPAAPEHTPEPVMAETPSAPEEAPLQTAQLFNRERYPDLSAVPPKPEQFEDIKRDAPANMEALEQGRSAAAEEKSRLDAAPADTLINETQPSTVTPPPVDEPPASSLRAPQREEGLFSSLAIWRKNEKQDAPPAHVAEPAVQAAAEAPDLAPAPATAESAEILAHASDPAVPQPKIAANTGAPATASIASPADEPAPAPATMAAAPLPAGMREPEESAQAASPAMDAMEASLAPAPVAQPVKKPGFFASLFTRKEKSAPAQAAPVQAAPEPAAPEPAAPELAAPELAAPQAAEAAPAEPAAIEAAPALAAVEVPLPAAPQPESAQGMYANAQSIPLPDVRFDPQQLPGSRYMDRRLSEHSSGARHPAN